MTEIPEHLRKRAEQARQRAAEQWEQEDVVSKIPEHLLERSREAARRNAETGSVSPELQAVIDRRLAEAMSGRRITAPSSVPLTPVDEFQWEQERKWITARCTEAQALGFRLPVISGMIERDDDFERLVREQEQINEAAMEKARDAWVWLHPAILEHEHRDILDRFFHVHITDLYGGPAPVEEDVWVDHGPAGDVDPDDLPTPDLIALDEARSADLYEPAFYPTKGDIIVGASKTDKFAGTEWVTSSDPQDPSGQIPRPATPKTGLDRWVTDLGEAINRIADTVETFLDNLGDPPQPSKKPPTGETCRWCPANTPPAPATFRIRIADNTTPTPVCDQHLPNTLRTLHQRHNPTHLQVTPITTY